jgi:hypothetical protein
MSISRASGSQGVGVYHRNHAADGVLSEAVFSGETSGPEEPTPVAVHGNFIPLALSAAHAGGCGLSRRDLWGHFQSARDFRSGCHHVNFANAAARA